MTTYTTTVQEIWDPTEGYIHYVTLPDELLEELGWDLETELIVEMKMGQNNNVIVISKANESKKTNRSNSFI